MTTDHQMAAMYAAQQEVIVALNEVGEVDLAGRLERCATARRERRGGDGWPHICRSAACVWCRRPMIRSWWYGMCQWTAEATTWSLATIPLHLSAGLPDAFAGCDVGCAMCAIERRGIGIDGATCAALVWPAVITRHW
jgi:hypothetical protein